MYYEYCINKLPAKLFTMLRVNETLPYHTLCYQTGRDQRYRAYKRRGG